MKNQWLLIGVLMVCIAFSCNRNYYKENVGVSNCGVLNPHLLDYYRDTLLTDYVSRKYPALKEYMIKRKDLKLLRTQNCLDSLVLINDKIAKQKIKIEIVQGDINIGNQNIKYFELLEFRFIETVNDLPTYGLFSDELEVRAIHTMNIQIGNKNIKVPREEYSHLYFPNFCNSFRAIKPLQVYKSKDEQFFYIYIFGNNGLKEDTKSIREVRSFMAKLIFNIEKGYIGKIVLLNTELDAYEWDCIDFEGI